MLSDSRNWKRIVVRRQMCVAQPWTEAGEAVLLAATQREESEKGEFQADGDARQEHGRQRPQAQTHDGARHEGSDANHTDNEDQRGFHGGQSDVAGRERLRPYGSRLRVGRPVRTLPRRRARRVVSRR